MNRWPCLLAVYLVLDRNIRTLEVRAGVDEILSSKFYLHYVAWLVAVYVSLDQNSNLWLRKLAHTELPAALGKFQVVELVALWAPILAYVISRLRFYADSVFPTGEFVLKNLISISKRASFD